jgi:hypothetical protein
LNAFYGSLLHKLYELCGLIIHDTEIVNSPRRRRKRPEECIPLRTPFFRKERDRGRKKREGEKEEKERDPV